MDEIKRENSAIEKVESIINEKGGDKVTEVTTQFEKVDGVIGRIYPPLRQQRRYHSQSPCKKCG